MASAKAAKRTALNSVARSSFVQCSIAFGAGYAAWWLWERCTTPAHGDIPVSAVPTSRSVPLRDEETPTTAADKREESPLNTSCPSVEDLVITSPTKPSVPPTADDTGVETADASTTQDLSLLEKIDGWYATREHARCVKLLRSQLATPASTANAGPSRVALMWRLARAQRTLVSFGPPTLTESVLLPLALAIISTWESTRLVAQLWMRVGLTCSGIKWEDVRCSKDNTGQSAGDA